jgi:poly(3-hydroxybutyrate) depolymerase
MGSALPVASGGALCRDILRRLLPGQRATTCCTDGCDGATVNLQSPDVELTSFSSCAGAKVVLYTIEGGWHEWPSIDSDAPLSELNASKVIVQYLESQSRR